jgi:IS30 family transposase
MTRHSSIEQERKMIEALRKGPVSTIEAAKNLDIVQPPSTIRRLRKKGFDIRTYWTYQSTEPSRSPHRVANYILMREAC